MERHGWAVCERGRVRRELAMREAIPMKGGRKKAAVVDLGTHPGRAAATRLATAPCQAGPWPPRPEARDAARRPRLAAMTARIEANRVGRPMPRGIPQDAREAIERVRRGAPKPFQGFRGKTSATRGAG